MVMTWSKGDPSRIWINLELVFSTITPNIAEPKKHDLKTSDTKGFLQGLVYLML